MSRIWSRSAVTLSLALMLWSCTSLPTQTDVPLVATPVPFVSPPRDSDAFMGVRVLGALELSHGVRNGLTVSGLSGLAWDNERQVLYALSDRGALFHLRPRFVGDRLVDVTLLAAYPLRDQAGHPLQGAQADSEGLVFDRGGTDQAPRLLVSFEAQPRLVAYTPDGRWLADLPLPAEAGQPERYRDPNSALEALALHPRWGTITGPEHPLANATDNTIPLWTAQEARWRYPLGSAQESALVDLAALPDGSLMALERAYVAWFKPLVISLRRVVLPEEAGSTAQVTDVAVFDAAQGWQLDNFEGLAYLGDGRLLMVSDDNNNPLQRTLLVYLSLTD